MKSPISQTVVAITHSPWIRLDYHAKGFAVGLFVSLSQDAAGVIYTVQHTPDTPDQSFERQVSIARVTTTATVTDVGHGLVTGDNVMVQASGDANLDGDHDITATGPDTYTYTVSNTGLTASLPTCRLNSFRVFPHHDLAALSAKADGNYAFPPMMCRLNVTALGAGKVTLSVVQGEGR